MRRILHVLTAPRAEGTPRLVLDCLAEPGWEQGVLCLSDRPAELAGELEAKATWFRLADVARPGWRKYRDIPRTVAAACRDFRPDLIIGWPTWTAGLIALGARSRPGPALVQHCGNPAHQDLVAIALGDIRFLPFYLAGGRFATCSDYVRDSFRRRTLCFGARFQTVYNSVRSDLIADRAASARAAWQRDPAERVLLMVATFEDHKDHATLLQAVARLRREGRCVRLRLAGNGSLRPAMEQLAGSLGIADIVEFLGSRQDVPELLGQADLFVFATTRQEGLGIVLLEAMAAGVPVVASDVPACRELLDGGRWGRLAPAHDPVALAAAVTAAWDESPLRTAAAAAYARDFTPRRMLCAYEALGLTGALPQAPV